MKISKITSLVFVLLFAFIGCRDESKNPTLDPEYGAYAKGQFLDASNNEIPTIFGAYSQTAVNAAVYWDRANTNEATSTTSVKAQVTWNAGKESVKISNIELYVQFIESYADKNNNVVTRSHGPGATPTVPEGKLLKTVPAAARLSPAQFNITPAEVYNLYKGTTFDYKGTGTAVDIFEANPYIPRKIDATLNAVGSRFLSIRAVDPTTVTTSTTSINLSTLVTTPSTATLSLTVGAGLNAKYPVGASVTVYSRGAYNNFVTGSVVSYDNTTGALVLNNLSKTGTSTRTDWDVWSGKSLPPDQISIKWRLIADDGRAFGSFHNNVCTQLTDANCNILFIVK